MFNKCYSLKNIEELKYLNTKYVEDFSNLFNCYSKNNFHDYNNSLDSKKYILLSDINPLKNWDVSKGINFDSMFRNCKSLSNINALENWDISKCENFSNMFCGCKSLKNINSLKNWNVSKGKNFSFMFIWCVLLSDIKSLKNWNTLNGKNFHGMFFIVIHCLILLHWKIGI